jgi:hypothetical protein
VGCAFVLAGAPARAQTADPRETQSRSECLAGRFQAGVDLLAQMFAETGDVNYIYNQGRCYEQNGRFSEAILHFREFLRKAKNLSAEEKAEVNGHIAECKAMKAEQDSLAVPAAAVPVTPPAPAAQPAPAATVAPALPAETAAPIPAGVVETTPSRPSADNRGASLRTAGIVTGSVGAAALIAGVIFSIETHNISDDLTSDAAKRSFSRNLRPRQVVRGSAMGGLRRGRRCARVRRGAVLPWLSNGPVARFRFRQPATHALARWNRRRGAGELLAHAASEHLLGRVGVSADCRLHVQSQGRSQATGLQGRQWLSIGLPVRGRHLRGVRLLLQPARRGCVLLAH